MESITTPSAPTVKEIAENTAEVEIRNCFPGYGVTLGNALRRVMLSSLQGSAITSVKIKDVEHEFSSIEGVLEDVVEIILNLKKIRFHLHSDEPVVLTLVKKKEGKITAADFEKSSDVEIMNPDAYIATLTSSFDFEMEVEIEKGLGYVATEQREQVQKEIGKIHIDAIFTPVKKVSYDVSDMRVGKRTDYNKINFTIETDGSIEPKEAFLQAAAILTEQYRSLAGIEEAELHEEQEEGKEKEEEQKLEIDLKKPVDQLSLSTRTSNALLENDIKTLGKLAKLTEEELNELDGLGQKGISEILETLQGLGLIESE